MADVYEFVTKQTAKILELDQEQAEDLYEGTNFVMELGVDEYDMGRIVLECEEQFGVDISEAEIEKIDTIKSLVVLVNAKIGD